MDAIDGDKLRGHLETLILATLEKGEAHGLEILRRLEDRGCGLLKLKEGSLYPALYRLEASGEVQATWEKEQKGRRGARRRIYRLSSKGQKKLHRGRGEWELFVSTIGQILAVTP
jgi:DNA-binding PadR family transcriptional regulator